MKFNTIKNMAESLSAVINLANNKIKNHLDDSNCSVMPGNSYQHPIQGIAGAVDAI